jgi:hypothetical protein
MQAMVTGCQARTLDDNLEIFCGRTVQRSTPVFGTTTSQTIFVLISKLAFFSIQTPSSLVILTAKITIITLYVKCRHMSLPVCNQVFFLQWNAESGKPFVQ